MPFYWTDRGQVRKMGEKVTVSAGNFEHVLVIEEWGKEDASGRAAIEILCPGYGNMKTTLQLDRNLLSN